MRSFYTPILLLATAIAVFFAGSAEATPRQQCNNKNSLFPPLIDRFCGKPNIVVPSPYASQPFYNYAHNAYVQISGGCTPGQWVPSKYCRSQFYQLCAAGDNYGANFGKFGRGGCQAWKMEATKNPNIKKKPKKGLLGKKKKISLKGIKGIVAGLPGH